MTDTYPAGARVEVEIEDPTTGETHTFSGATEAEADAAAERFFGVNDAQERDND
jgi:hypothetical protein